MGISSCRTDMLPALAETKKTRPLANVNSVQLIPIPPGRAESGRWTRRHRRRLPQLSPAEAAACHRGSSRSQ